MLRKLYKYEFLSLFRTLLPVYAAVLGFAVINRLSFLINSYENGIMETLQGFAVIGYVVSIIAVLAVGFITVIIRFYKNLLTEEGYLTFTLPVTPNQHIICKLLCGVTVIVVNFIVVAISLLILGVGTEFLKLFFEEIKIILDYYTSEYGLGNIVLIIVMGAVMMIMALMQAIMMLYASMSVGQRFKNKILGSAIAYISFYFLMEIIILIISSPILLKFALDFEKWVETSVTGVQVLLGGLIVMYLLFATGYWLITRYFLSNKLNLE